MYKLGIDVGGTNTDVVLIDEQDAVVAAVKRPTYDDIYTGIMDAVDAVLEASGADRALIGRAMLGTTQCTNAIVERRNLASVAVLRVGAPASVGIPPMVDWADDLAAVSRGSAIIEGGFEYDGRRLAAFDEGACRAFFEGVRGKVDAVALSCVFSTVRDDDERRAAEVAREAGAIVFPRHNDKQVGKGYALDWGLKAIWEQYADKDYEAYFVFDADNVLDVNYFREMNATFDGGAKASTSYRNSKNYGDNWISAGYGLWFLRDAAFLNEPRTRLGLSAVVSGTGYVFSRDIMLRCGGWPFHSLSEDTEFTVNSILQGHRIGYCGEAELFDEQPTSLVQSCRQRMRWVRGNLMVFLKEGGTVPLSR